MKLKYYMRGVGSGILFTLFIFVVIIIPNLKLEQKISDNTNPSSIEQPGDGVASIVGKNPEVELGPDDSSFTPPVKQEDSTAENPDTSGSFDTNVSDKNAFVKSEETTEKISDSQTGNPSDSLSTDDNEDSPERNNPQENESESEVDEGDGRELADETIQADNSTAKSDYEASNSDNAIEKNGAVDSSTGDVTFSITKGMTSETFCKAMEKYGIINDWKALNGYISRHGYSGKIQIGTFTFKKGMSHEDICRKIMGKNVK